MRYVTANIRLNQVRRKGDFVCRTPVLDRAFSMEMPCLLNLFHWLTFALFGWPEWNEFRREWNGPFSPSKNFVVWLGQKNGMVHSLNHSILDRQYTTYSRTKQRDSSIPFSSLLPHKINIYKNCPLYPCPAILSELRTLPNLQSSTNMSRFH